MEWLIPFFKSIYSILFPEKHDKEKLKEQERLRLEKEMAEKAAKEVRDLKA